MHMPQSGQGLAPDHLVPSRRIAMTIDLSMNDIGVS